MTPDNARANDTGLANLVLIKGAGDLASGVALRLHHAGFPLVMTEIALPTSVRRTVCFSRAVTEKSAVVEDVKAVLVDDDDDARGALHAGHLALYVDGEAGCVRRLRPAVLVDGIMAKRNVGTALTDAPVVIALGPGFIAGEDCHGVIETQRGHTLGRVITSGSALPDTGVPGDIGGHTTERLIRAPCAGFFHPVVSIGDTVFAGDIAAVIFSQAPACPRCAGCTGSPDCSGCGLSPTAAGEPVVAQIDGMVRGILPEGMPVQAGMKCGDVDPRGERAHCFTVSDKALAVAGGVLEAILRFRAAGI
ncbi:MAG: EF2563 family selenium-dependent molybdenum hydroxylase system protein [Spirochaetaceae bacterium]|jgi:xanthine dehydrogenase accessory factor|nr:EF2563 family selenium-dependent molybdenum hydroxylase system protein [Spirochaetaceae bacterium]